MGRTHLDENILKKLSNRVGKKLKYVREQISKRASKQGISSEAAQILWAKEFGIGTASFQRSLPAHVQEQVRTGLSGMVQTKPPTYLRSSDVRSAGRHRGQDHLRLAVDQLLADNELKERCGDLLKAKGKFDRVFRESTTVLDDRLKKLGGITTKMNPTDLVGKVLNPDPNKAILVVSKDSDEQEGFFSICKGIFLAFRNPAHHQLTDKFKREDALRFCAFVDAVLAVLDQAHRNP